MVQGGMTIVKYILFAFNLIFVVSNTPVNYCYCFDFHPPLNDLKCDTLFDVVIVF